MLLWWVLWPARQSRLLSRLWKCMQGFARTQTTLPEMWSQSRVLNRHKWKRKSQLQFMVKCIKRHSYNNFIKFCNNLFLSTCNPGPRLICENDPCLSDSKVIEDINKESRSLGWKAYNYSEFYGHKLKEGLQYRLGTFEPRVKVKSMSRLSNRLETLDSEFYSLNHWPGLISPIRDQGWCG